MVDPMKEAQAGLRAAAKKAQRCRRDKDAATDKVRRIDIQAAEAETSKVADTERFEAECTAAMMDGEALPVPDPVVVDRIRENAAKIAAAERARPKAVEQANQAERELDRAQAELTAARLIWVASNQEQVRVRLSALLESAASDLARLCALDQLQSGMMVGEKFVAKGGPLLSPWSGEAAVNRLLAGLVQRLRPAGISDAEIKRLTAVEFSKSKTALKEIEQ